MSSFEKEYYEASTFWSDGALTDAGNTIRIKATIDLIPDDVDSLVDVGCGNGILIHALLSSNTKIKLLGIDRSEEALKYVEGNKIVGDIINIPQPSNSFDCVSCLQVLEHLPVNVYHLALSELARVSNKYIIIGVPYREKIEENVTSCPQCKTIFNVDLHLRSYLDSDIENLFSKLHFKLIEKVNVVKSKDFLFNIWAQKFKNNLAPRKNNSDFNSPICPICGFKNSHYELQKPLSIVNQSTSFFLSIKNLVKSSINIFSPKIEKEGYWVIALYKKRNS